MRIIKTIPLVLFALFVLSLTKTNAQSIPKNTFKLDVGAEALRPLSAANDFYDIGIGGTARLNYGLTDKLAVTLTSGYYHFNYKGSGNYNLYDVNIIPIKAGLKYFLIPNVYVNGEAGVGLGRTPINYTKTIISGGFGWVYKGLDVGLKYENNFGRYDGFKNIGLRVGYGFKL
ncbi:hypothetical protein D0C36_22355 [Mucilaginibacter conchicola]|uniref:Outer membrane protein beta-barrel domain-containing protein n=1 Tax=Mucilaginibacter conchicola TaxID=2303333 RepID=A0A372NNL7_9SPHI|nr:hypothetical protein [Mucilaginibacter conchicola]RFZ90524.1 hypothetical protein D0C36_22355 [Mucilaginibacter conchicola]